MWYGAYETLLNVKNLIITKIFYPKARLVRFPSYIRNKKYISFGKGFTCGYNCRLECVKNLEGNIGQIVLGENVKIGDNVHIASADCVEIGDNVLMASHIFISDLDHGVYEGENATNPSISPDERPIYGKSIRIGNNVWIGENVVILKGVTVGNGCVIGANALVNQDVPDKTIVVGAPARVIKRFDEESGEWINVRE